MRSTAVLEASGEDVKSSKTSQLCLHVSIFPVLRDSSVQRVYDEIECIMPLMLPVKKTLDGT